MVQININPLMTGKEVWIMDWGDAATWCATGVAVVSAVVSVWWPWHNRPQASWFAAMFKGDMLEQAFVLHGLLPFSPSNGRGMPDMLLEMLNDGDGAAFNVTTSMEGGECLIVEGHKVDVDDHAHVERPSLNMVEPGGRFLLSVWCDEPDANLLVHWTLQPTRLDKRVYCRIGLVGECEAQPVAPIPEPDHDSHPWLWWYRLTHWRISQSRPARFARRFLQAVRSSHNRKPDS